MHTSINLFKHEMASDNTVNSYIFNRLYYKVKATPMIDARGVGFLPLCETMILLTVQEQLLEPPLDL